jgi:hypothetical protein
MSSKVKPQQGLNNQQVNSESPASNPARKRKNLSYSDVLLLNFQHMHAQIVHASKDM